MSKNEKMEGYIIPIQVSTVDRILRSTVGLFASTVSGALAGYTAYNAAAYNPEIENLLGAVISRMSSGVVQTIIDIKIVVETLSQYPDIISQLNGDSIPKEIIDTATELYEYIEGNATAAAGNFIRKPLETGLSALGIASLIRFLGNFLTKLLIWRDKPDFDQRLRSKIWNFPRSLRKSRKVVIPAEGEGMIERR